ncbi:hypothetical protein [Mycolicibacterium aubagnense]|uniref:Uncharacterized protein n=1 Tax=Mycolicibacterium aubagnense TaxID=319707 RepID=A0ABN5YKP9_9MYCO|nr:hypothetical protein [Mycolicibacterium aubagnense]TLH64471.1 hypothetical protein C1S80_12185 [Mycolicibacterium aubagnense]BBX82169.1 hypothetical protein MAUB_00420 [Mycolicibacterium aubagnense]
MARTNPRTTPSTPAVVKGRLANAIEFLEAAEKVLEHNEAATSASGVLFVDAGIAASDVICCVRLGEYSTGSEHQHAVALLTKVEPSFGKDLSMLLKVKNKVNYTHAALSASECKQMHRAATHLVEAAKAAGASAS